MLQDKYDIDIVDVGVCWAGDDMAVDLVEECVAVMSLQNILYGKAFFLGPLNGFPIYDGTSHVCWAICAVGSEACHNDVRESIQFLRSG